MKKKFILAAAVFSCLTSFIPAQDEWKLSGQIQLRSELDGRDFSNRTHPLTFASLRTRVGVEKTFLDKINFFVQFQDSRIFGEEKNTLASISNIDLHQGYIILKRLFDWEMDLQAGRFEVVYGTERFLGAVGWHYIGRAWDGVRLKFYPGFKLDLFALTHTESVSYIANAVPAAYPDDPSTATPSYSIYGFWESMNISRESQLDVFGYYEINRERSSGSDDYMLNRFTVGLNHFATFGRLSTTAEGAYQFGKIGSSNISAYLLSLQAFFNINGLRIGAGADLISGSDEESLSSGRFNHFYPSFGTNHKFYGYMDYFINIPANTYGLGLNDFYLNLIYVDQELEGTVSFHQFTSNTKPDISPTYWVIGNSSVTKIDDSNFGQEIDLTIKYNFLKGTAITWGGSLFIPGKLMKLIFHPKGDDAAFWSYLMITANI